MQVLEHWVPYCQKIGFEKFKVPQISKHYDFKDTRSAILGPYLQNMIFMSLEIYIKMYGLILDVSKPPIRNMAIVYYEPKPSAFFYCLYALVQYNINEKFSIYRKSIIDIWNHIFII